MTSSRVSDNWLCAGLLALGCVAIWGIPAQLHAVRNAADAKKPITSPSMVSQETEDAIKLETFSELVKSPNFDTREGSIAILKSRLLESDAPWRILLEYLASSDSRKRRRALTIIRFVLPEDSFPSSLQVRWWQAPFLNALVKCLHNLLPEAHAAARDDTYITGPLRIALEILSIMLHGATSAGVEMMLYAGLVRDWLRYYPLRGRASLGYPKDLDKGRTVKYIINNEDREKWHPPELQKILENFLEFGLGKISMAEEGLWDIHMAHKTTQGHPTFRDPISTADEVILRRRRRQAIVMGEEGRPIEQQDIIQPET